MSESSITEMRLHPLRPAWIYAMCRSITRLVGTLMFDLKIYNTHFIPPTGGVLVVANHQSYLDPVLIGCTLRRPMSYLAKSGLFSNRYFGWLLRNLRAFPVKQGEGDVGAVKETIRRLKEGHMLTIFAEGSRCEDGEIAEMQAGASLVVRRAGVSIVPCVIEGSFKAWPRTRKLPLAHPVSVMFGPVMNVEGLSAREITKLIDVTLRKMFAELREKRRGE